METLKIRGEIRYSEPLSSHTSFSIGGPADALAFPADQDDLTALLGEIRKRGMPHFILGGGTNLLVRDKGIRGVVISLQSMRTIKIEREYRSIGGTFAVIAADAGVPLPKLLAYSADEGLTGLEFAAGIPGTVGGAVCMNAGTAAGEMGDIIESVTLISPDGTMIVRGRDEMGFGYRASSIPEGHLVLTARLILRREEKERIRARIKELLDTRKRRQPSGFPNAGSVFKNPLEESAAKLIESAGLKGKTVGGAQVSEKHANFIVNIGKASASDVIKLMELVKEKVLEVHKVRLEPEIKVIGEE